MSMCMYVFRSVYMYISMCVYMSVCVCMYVYMYVGGGERRGLGDSGFVWKSKRA
jgi:hypothetical protein